MAFQMVVGFNCSTSGSKSFEFQGLGRKTPETASVAPF